MLRSYYLLTGCTDHTEPKVAKMTMAITKGLSMICKFENVANIYLQKQNGIKLI